MQRELASQSFTEMRSPRALENFWYVALRLMQRVKFIENDLQEQRHIFW
jgi:hypothetical protein